MNQKLVRKDANSFFDNLNEPFMSVKLKTGNLSNELFQREDPVIRCLTLVDPTTMRVLCKINNPQVKISGFKSDCIDLKRYMQNNLHNFWFDPEEPVVVEKRPLKDYLRDILLPEERRIDLWNCIKEMIKIKKLYNRLVAQK